MTFKEYLRQHRMRISRSYEVIEGIAWVIAVVTVLVILILGIATIVGGLTGTLYASLFILFVAAVLVIGILTYHFVYWLLFYKQENIER